MTRKLIVFSICLTLAVIATQIVQAQTVNPDPEYEPLGDLLQDTAGIGFFVGLLLFVGKIALPPKAAEWYYDKNEWLVNLTAVLLSVGGANLGAWLNLMAFDARSVVEYIWKGMLSAGVATFGYEFLKNLGRKEKRIRAARSE